MNTYLPKDVVIGQSGCENRRLWQIGFCSDRVAGSARPPAFVSRVTARYGARIYDAAKLGSMPSSSFAGSRAPSMRLFAASLQSSMPIAVRCQSRLVGRFCAIHFPSPPVISRAALLVISALAKPAEDSPAHLFARPARQYLAQTVCATPAAEVPQLARAGTRDCGIGRRAISGSVSDAMIPATVRRPCHRLQAMPNLGSQPTPG